MKNTIPFSIFILTTICTGLSFGQGDEKGSHVLRNDTCYYNVETGSEGSVTEECIKTYLKNGNIVADILKTSYIERHYAGQPVYRSKTDTLSSITSWILSKSKIDTLANFIKMVTAHTIIHNQGVKIAGRHGIYSVIENGDTVATSSRELYSLTDALGFDRR